MSTRERIRLCILIEKMDEQKSYSEKLGLENKSTFHGKTIKKEGNRIC